MNLEQRHQTTQAEREARRDERIERRLERHHPPLVSDVPREGTQPPPQVATSGHSSGSHNWNGNWRHDHRYDWHKHRNHHRSLFRLGFYYDPFGWGYRPYSIGWRLWPSYYRRGYWLSDPSIGRLPPAYAGDALDPLLVRRAAGRHLDRRGRRRDLRLLLVEAPIQLVEGALPQATLLLTNHRARLNETRELDLMRSARVYRGRPPLALGVPWPARRLAPTTTISRRRRPSVFRRTRRTENITGPSGRIVSSSLTWVKRSAGDAPRANAAAGKYDGLGRPATPQFAKQVTGRHPGDLVRRPSQACAGAKTGRRRRRRR